MDELTLETPNKKAIVDLTQQIQEWLDQHEASDGLCHLFVKHTTAALTLADLDPGTDLDMLDAFEAMVPKLNYRHPHNPEHVPDHIVSALIGPEISVPVQGGQLTLGTWQRIVLVELDGPRSRNLILSFQPLNS